MEILNEAKIQAGVEKIKTSFIVFQNTVDDNIVYGMCRACVLKDYCDCLEEHKNKCLCELIDT